MATADPGSFPFQTTVAVTAYPAAATVSGAQFGSGRWTIVNPDAALSIYVSQDGVNDYVIIPPGAAWTSDSAAVHAKIWLKLSSAGSVVVTGQCTCRAYIVGAGG